MSELRTAQRIQRGREAFERRDYVAALADFREVLEQHPDFADIRHLAGLCLNFLGQLEAALEQFERAVTLNERYVEAHLNRAITLNELGRYDEARAAFDRAREHETSGESGLPGAVSARLANAHMGVGDLYFEAGVLEEAAAQYRRALEIRPAFADIRNKLAQTLIEQGDLASAERELRLALDLNPRFLAARLNLGLVHFRNGDAALAAEEWESCREQDPGSSQARAYLAMLAEHAAAGGAGGGA